MEGDVHEDDDEDGTTRTRIVPRRWSWAMAAALVLGGAGAIAHAGAEILTDFSIAFVAHHEYGRTRAEMAEQAVREIETLTGVSK